MLHRIITKIQYMELKRKFNSIAFAAVFFVGLFSIMATAYVLKKYDHMLYQTTSDSTANIVSNLSSKLDTVSVLTDHLIANDAIQSNLMIMETTEDSIEYSRARKSIYDSLNYYLFSNPYITSVNLVLNDQIIHLGRSFSLAEADLIAYNEKAASLNGRYFWTFQPSETGNTFIIRDVRQKAYLSLKHLATLYIEFDFNTLVTDTLTETNNHKSLFVVMADDFIITPKDVPYYDEYSELVTFTEPYIIQNIQGSRMFITNGTIPATNWKYLNFVDYNSIFSQIRLLKVQYALIILAAIFVAILLTNKVTGNIFRYFQILVKKMQHFEKGHLEPLPTEFDSSERRDELGMLNHAFDEMVRNLNRLINDNYVKQLLLKDAELIMLQRQINPHFLYNTLDAINWMAQQYDAEDISIMTRSLGNLFRGIVSAKGDFLPLSSDLSMMQNYISIQTYRFKERLQYHMNIPEKYHSIEIPNMTLQPLIENAIEHGLENSFDPCIINLSLIEKKEHYEISISNTGSEFEEDLLYRIQCGELVPKGTGIGLLNIDKRLKLIYGNDFGLAFKNRHDTAIVIITIPKNIGKERRIRNENM